MEGKHCHHSGLHIGLSIARVALKAAGVAAAFCLVHEAHKMHKAIERREKK